MDKVPQRRPSPPRCSSSCPAELPPIWGVLWVFFLLLQPLRRPRLRRQSWGPPPWCGAAAAEVSETARPGAGRARARGHGHSHVGESAAEEAAGQRPSPLPRAVTRFCLLCLSPRSLLQDAVPLLTFVFRSHSPSQPLRSGFPLLRTPSPFLSFFLEAVLERGEGASLARVLPAHLLAGTGGHWWLAGGCDWEASKRLGGG